MTELYTLEKKTADATFPRANGSTICATDRLKLSYNKYFTVRNTIPKETIKINLIFAHGTGMNKSIWNYHIRRLYDISERSEGWKLNSVLAIDAAGHGDSAMLNEGKPGWIYKWEDGAKDLIQVIKQEQRNDNEFVNGPYTKNILVGHSLGGFQAIMAAYYEPSLFDAVIPIEPVIYMDIKHAATFTKIFNKMAAFIIDKFDDEDQFNEYFKEFSFYKNMKPDVLRDLMEDEVATFIDPETKETRYMTKASNPSQMATYLSAVLSIPAGMAILPHLRTQVCHIIGDKATWNPPESIPYIRNAIPNEYLMDPVDIRGGQHLVNGEQPDEIIQAIENVILKRVEAAIENKQYVPEVKYAGNRSEILKAQWDLMTQGKIEQASKFSKPEDKPKL